MASLAAECKGSQRIVQTALEIKRLTANHGTSNAKSEKVLLGKKEKKKMIGKNSQEL